MRYERFRWHFRCRFCYGQVFPSSTQTKPVPAGTGTAERESLNVKPVPAGTGIGVPIPKPPFWGYRVLDSVPLDKVLELVNRNALFRGQWQFRKGNLTVEEHEKSIQDKAEPIFKELSEKCIRENILKPKIVYGYYPCYSEGNDLVVLEESGEREKSPFHLSASEADAAPVSGGLF